MTLFIHIVAGSIGLVTGYAALYSTKGAPLHRRAGRAFVYAMLVMCVAGTIVSATQGIAEAINIPAGVLTAYLALTAFTTVKPARRADRWISVGAMLTALAVGVTSLSFGFEAVANGGMRNGMPAFPFFMFGTVGMIASIGDLRVLRSGALTGSARIARHLWRMTFALFIAAMSFFIGQADVIPEPLRIRPLIALPVLDVFVTMCYWLWRVRVRRALRGLVLVKATESVPV